MLVVGFAPLAVLGEVDLAIDTLFVLFVAGRVVVGALALSTVESY